MKEEYRWIKGKQIIIFTVIVVVTVGLLSIGILMSESPKSKRLEEVGSKKIEISKIAEGVKAQDRWLEKAEGELKALNKKLEQNDKEKEQTEVRLGKLEESAKEEKEDNNIDDKITALKEEIEELRAVIDSKAMEPLSASEDVRIEEKKINNHELKLSERKEMKNYVAAGSYAKAVLISAVDASVGIKAQSEPRAVLLRVTSKAKSAYEGEKQQETDIKGCTVIGAAVGDLSSERVFIRLLKMTCSKDDGKVIEKKVEGYVSGIGKAGIRGEVVSREGDFVVKSFLAGIVSNAGNGIMQKFSPSGGLFSQEGTSNNEIIGSSVGKGVSSSANRLSEYLIQRAEQYQPVISISSGIEVEVVFNEGIHLEEL